MMKGTTKFMSAYAISEEIELHSGSKQGDIISPLLYLIFLEPFLKKWKQCAAFADDIAITGNRATVDLIFQDLLKYLNLVSTEINVKKCGLMLHGSKPNIKDHLSDLPTVLKYKYLGYLITEDNDSSHHLLQNPKI
jgi:hypothetical protein